MAESPVDQTSKNFGLVIAFLVPGFIGLWALSYFDPTAAKWLGTAAEKETTVGGFLFVVVASLGIGVFLSGARYFVFDKFLLKDLGGRPDVEDANRKEAEASYQSLKADYYQFYQFYANTAVALVLAFGAWWVTKKPPAGDVVLLGVVTAVVEVILYLSARDSLTKYHRHTIRLLGLRTPPTSPGKNKAA